VIVATGVFLRRSQTRGGLEAISERNSLAAGRKSICTCWLTHLYTILVDYELTLYLTNDWTHIFADRLYTGILVYRGASILLFEGGANLSPL
jgi:hypothetical protein